MSVNSVQHLCRQALQSLKTNTPEFPIRKLNQEHIDFLTSDQTLEIWAGKTMLERTVLFHRRFPDKRIAATSLRRLYLAHKIKRKKVR